MTDRMAQCSCGQLSVVCAADPVRIAVCHCLACKRRTGSAFGVSAWFRESDVTISGPANTFVRIGDEGSRITHSFCPNCGATVYYRNAEIDGRIAVPAGAFADVSFPPPTVSVYHDSRRQAWVEIRADPLEKRG